MFAIPTPYLAERQVYTKVGETRKPSWEPCRVIGIDKDDEGDLRYIVEVFYNGTSSLMFETDIRRRERSRA